MGERRYDIDWIRVIAIGLLLLYHVAIGFQPWGIMIGFIANDQPWQSLWVPMTMLNVWRIPLLFFVSGMGVYFALRNRTWKQLLSERAMRILLPFLFGIMAIVPIHVYIWQHYYHFDVSYMPGPGHLWFLGNLFSYVIVLSPVFYYLRRQEGKKLAHWAAKLFRRPIGLFPVFAVFIAEALIINPMPFELYAMTWHGFFLGLAAFFFGFFFVWCGTPFWTMLLRWRGLFLAAAMGLFVLRLSLFQPMTPNYLLSVESNCWILGVFGFGYKYLNYPSKVLSYLSQAAYPVYIVHMIFLYLGSLLIFPLQVGAPVQFILLLMFTAVGCFAFCELFVKRIPFIRPLFGLKKGRTQSSLTINSFSDNIK